MIARVLSQRLVLLVIGLAAGSGILIPASYGSFHPVTSSEIEDGTIQSIDIGNGQVRTADLGGNSVTAAKIKDGEVKAAEIATDAVGASEIKGVTKLIFSECFVTAESIPAHGGIERLCLVPPAAGGDNVIATLEYGSTCFGVTQATVQSADTVLLVIQNHCSSSETFGNLQRISIIVYNI